MTMQRILLVDDHEIVRLGLKSLLERHPKFQVVAEASTGNEAVQKVEQYLPDIVVMDIRLPGGSGVKACNEILKKYPDTRVIMLTTYAEDEMLFSAIRAGASGYILKQVGNDELIKAIEAAGRGESPLDPAVTQRVFQEVRKAAREEEALAFSALTDQEKQVLIHVSEGKTNREIAKALYLGEGTVRNYVSSILSKLDVSNRAEAAAYAVKHDLRNHLVHLTKD
ncbi:MAG: response regulator transcription factor [Chloroflexota bacterium]|nr:response regulator transcription factor [Chloroflexota bacterium]